MSSGWKILRGNTTSNNLRTCEIVSAGAFFFQPVLEMPQKERGQHTRAPVMMPARVWADFRVVHAQCGLRFLEAWLTGLPPPPEPDQQPPGDTHGRGTEIGTIPRLRAEGALEA